MQESPKILIVDDEPSTAEMFRLMLDQAGYRVAVAHGTGVAINALRRERPDLLLLDVMMPGVSGLELCRYVRRDPEWAHLPIVLISAKSQPEDIQEGLEAGATVYLTKPVAKDELLESIRRALNKGEAR